MTVAWRREYCTLEHQILWHLMKLARSRLSWIWFVVIAVKIFWRQHLICRYWADSNPPPYTNYLDSWLFHETFVGEKANMIKASDPTVSAKLFIPHRDQQTDHVPIKLFIKHRHRRQTDEHSYAKAIASSPPTTTIRWDTQPPPDEANLVGRYLSESSIKAQRTVQKKERLDIAIPVFPNSIRTVVKAIHRPLGKPDSAWTLITSVEKRTAIGGAHCIPFIPPRGNQWSRENTVRSRPTIAIAVFLLSHHKMPIDALTLNERKVRTDDWFAPARVSVVGTTSLLFCSLVWRSVPYNLPDSQFFPTSVDWRRQTGHWMNVNYEVASSDRIGFIFFVLSLCQSFQGDTVGDGRQYYI